MSKTTFLGYVPSLKSKHEATIVGHKAIESKGGSIRYTLQGEYQGRKTLPKTVSKADFEGIYGFDAKEAEAVIIHGKKKMHPSVKTPLRTVVAHKIGVEDKDGFIPTYIDAGDFKDGITLSEGLFENHAETVVGNPSPASVEPPAPSEKPFPQEPSNENFSADKDYAYEPTDEEMAEIWEREQKMRDLEPTELLEDDDYTTLEGTLEKEEEKEPEIEYYDHVELEEIDGKLIVSLNTIQFFEGDAGDLLEDVRANSNWEWLTADQLGALSEADVLAKGSYSDDGEFEPAENVVYAYTDYQISDWFQELKENGVVVFNGFPVEKSEVKEAFGFGKKDEEEEEPKTQEFTVVLQEGDKLELTDIEEETEEEQPADDEPKEEDSPEESEIEEKEAVQAKVTRPVKEDETEDDEESEGLSTLAKVGLGVGALAVGAAIFGAEGEYPQEFLDEFYDFDSNPTADTQDEETLAIAYAAWLESKRNEENIPYQAETDYTEIYGATSGDGYISHDRIDTEEQRTVELRHDNPTTYYNWNSPYDVDDTEVEDAIKSELGDEPGEGNYGATVEVRGSKYSQQGQKYVDVDVDMDTDYGDSRFMGMAAESFEAGNMMVKLQEVDGEAPYYNCPYCRNELTVLGGKGGIVAVCENESRCNGLEIPRQYLDDYEKYHWYVNERSSAENFSAEFEATTGYGYDDPSERMTDEEGWLELHERYKDDEEWGQMTLEEFKKSFIEAREEDYQMQIKYEQRLKDEGRDMDGNPIKEAESKNLKMALGITAVGIGLAAVLGKEKIKTLFDRFGL